MNKAAVLAFIDAEIERLTQARQLLASGDSGSFGLGRPGRGFRAGVGGFRRRRHMSAEARRRISEAQKRRWAARKRGQ
jgi:hypothetical protein